MLVLIYCSLEVYIIYFIIKTASYSKFVIFFLFRKANLLQPQGIDLLASFKVLPQKSRKLRALSTILATIPIMLGSSRLLYIKVRGRYTVKHKKYKVACTRAENLAKTLAKDTTS